MNVRAALKLQYHAALKTLRLAIERCPDAVWDDPKDGLAAFWRVAYHTLFYTHFYLQRDEHSFARWAKHRADSQCTGYDADEGRPRPAPCEAYTRAEILEYLQVCEAAVDPAIDTLDLAAAESGFSWYPMPKLEHQLVNIRHIQHHAAALASRLRREAGIEIEWVSRA